MATTSSSSNSGFDWDSMLLGLDWIETDWRTYLATLNSVPWEELQLTTVEQLGALHADWDRRHPGGTGNSPTALELLRRDLNEAKHPSAMTETQTSRDWITEQEQDDRGSRPGAIAPPSPPRPRTDWVRDTTRPAFYTAGFELELPIAVYRRDRAEVANANPHPAEARWLAQDIVDEAGDPDPARVRQIVVDRVLEVLNAQTDMVFVPKDPAEGQPLHDLQMANLLSREEGTDRAGPSGADDTPVHGAPARSVSAVAQQAARNALAMVLLTHFAPEVGGKRLVTATEADIKAATRATPILGVPASGDVTQARIRLEELLRLEVFRAKRDPKHVALLHMKPRYRAFSVYAMTNIHLDDMTESAEYADAPKEPFDPYHYEVVKIASPVLRMTRRPQDIENMLTQICRTMRNNFRIHKDVPSIPVTTQITVSHTTGLNLIDIKKFVTLLVVLRDKGFSRLNRVHRTGALYDKHCGPITERSRLGALSYMDAATIKQNEDDVLPRPAHSERRGWMNLMEQHLPKDLMAALKGEGKLSDRVFLASLWSYSTVNSIARGVTTGAPFSKTEVVIKCTGDGAMSNTIVPTAAEEVFAASTSLDLNFDVVDADRGVFEFRQCGGSLDPTHIMTWMMICCTTVDTAKRYEGEAFRNLLTRILNDEQPILDALHVPAVIQQFFETHILGNTGFFEPDDSQVRWEDPFYRVMK
ncbi:hypothetical protein F4781DRAFT_442506 [Annulohypoxylon bovei var. microspora]|nr:hypothetical protein F4781DRAFT_442506 [Annulohypoxylon bovei var. microspora]